MNITGFFLKFIRQTIRHYVHMYTSLQAKH